MVMIIMMVVVFYDAQQLSYFIPSCPEGPHSDIRGSHVDRKCKNVPRIEAFVTWWI